RRHRLFRGRGDDVAPLAATGEDLLGWIRRVRLQRAPLRSRHRHPVPNGPPRVDGVAGTPDGTPARPGALSRCAGGGAVGHTDLSARPRGEANRQDGTHGGGGGRVSRRLSEACLRALCRHVSAIARARAPRADRATVPLAALRLPARQDGGGEPRTRGPARAPAALV